MLLGGSLVLSLKPSWCWIIAPYFCLARCSNHTFQRDIRSCFDLASGVAWTQTRVCAHLPGLWSACAGAAGSSAVQLSTLCKTGSSLSAASVVFICTYTGGQIAARLPVALLFEVPPDIHLVTGPVFRWNPCRAPCRQVKCSRTSPRLPRRDRRRQSLSLFLLMVVNLSSTLPYSPAGFVGLASVSLH